MSQIAEGISQVASIGAAVFKFIPGGQAISAALTVVASAASVVAQLTAAPPLSVPNIGDQQIGTNLPAPYVMGQARSRGSLVYIEAHGDPLDGVPNPFLSRAWVHSVAGPVQSMGTFRANQEVISFNAVGEPPNAQRKAIGYYDRFMWLDDQVGNQPTAEAMEITDNFNQEQYWTSAHKLNGMAASLLSIRADDKETHYASGIPDTDRIMQGVKVYDPRKDDTYTGGSGAHRARDESTYEYSTNPALHALTYAIGRFANGIHIFGAKMPDDAIRYSDFVDFANLCDLNGWTIGGTIFESGEEGELWNNLKLILDAGGAKPTIIGGKLGVAYQAPRVALTTIEESDLIGPYSVPGFRPWSKQKNTVVPRYMSAANNWEYVASQAYQDASLLAAQGEERQYERQFDLVTDKDQATELAVYDLWDEIEQSPITLTVKPRFIAYDVHDAVTLNLPNLGLDGVTAVILQHTIDYETGFVTLLLRTDTAQKHIDALGQLGTAPFHPPVIPNEELDGAVGRLNTYDSVTGIIEGTQSVGDTRLLGLLDGTQEVPSLTLPGRVLVSADLNTYDAVTSSVNDGATGLVATRTLAVGTQDAVNNPVTGLSITRTELGDVTGDVSDILDGTQPVGDTRIAGIIAGTQPLADVTFAGRGSLIDENITRDANIQDAKNQSAGVLSASLTPPSASVAGSAGSSATTNDITYEITGGTAPYSWTLTRTVNNNSSTASATSGTTATGTFNFTANIPATYTPADKYEFEVTDDNSDTYLVEISANFINNV